MHYKKKFDYICVFLLSLSMDSKETGLETSSRHRFQHDGNS